MTGVSGWDSNRLRGWLRAVPLFGGLADCRWQDHWESIRHISVVLVMSTTPIWLAALIIYGLENQAGHLEFGSALYMTIKKGQLFMYCTSFLAPLFWISLVDPKGARNFPSKLPHMFLVGIIDLVAASFFALTIAGTALRESYAFHLSVIMVLASVVLRYLGMVYHASRMPNARLEFKQQEDDFASALREHRP